MNDHQDQVLNQLPEGIIVIDTDETVTFVNHQSEEILGLSRDQLIDQPITKVIESAKLPFVLRTRKKQFNQTVMLNNGKTVITSRIPLIDESNNLKGAIAVFYDVADIVQLAEQVTNWKETEQTLKAVVDTSEAAIHIVDENGKTVFVNSAYTDWTGLTSQDIIGQPIDRYMSKESNIHRKVLQSRRSVTGVRMGITSSNKQIVANGTPVPVDGKLKGSVAVLRDVSKEDRVETELSKARELIRHLETTYKFSDIIGHSTAMQLAIEQAKVAAKTSTPVLIRGETGTEKDLVAYAIHHESDRKYHKIIFVDCAMMSQEALEKRLFGFQGDNALVSQQGYVEQANNGTLLLHDIDQAPVPVQSKLLQLVKYQQVQPINSKETLPVNVRLIMTTEINLEKAMLGRTFDQDFYYLLNQMSLTLPPLRERTIDLEALIEVMLRRLNHYFGQCVATVDSEALEVLKAYTWPKNVRELEHTLSAAMVYMAPNKEVIQKQDLPLQVCKSVDVVDSKPLLQNRSLHQMMEAYEQQVIQSTFASQNFNKTKTAEALGISIRNLYYKMQKYDIDTN